MPAANDRKLILGIDIGGAKCAVTIAEPDGTILHRRNEPTRGDDRSPAEVLDCLAAHARSLMTVANASRSDMIGAGVSLLAGRAGYKERGLSSHLRTCQSGRLSRSKLSLKRRLAYLFGLKTMQMRPRLPNGSLAPALALKISCS